MKTFGYIFVSLTSLALIGLFICATFGLLASPFLPDRILGAYFIASIVVPRMNARIKPLLMEKPKRAKRIRRRA